METRKVTVIGFFVIISMLGRSDVGATTLYVSEASSSPAPPYATWDTAAHGIQEAVDAASDGDTVLVGAGEYALTNQITVAKAILLRSDMGASQTIISGQIRVRCLWIGNPGALVDGFTIKDGWARLDAGGGVFLIGAVVQNCTVQSCWSSTAGAGVTMFGGMLSNCVVSGNGRPPIDSQFAVYCSGGLITACQIVNSGDYDAALVAAVYLTHSELRNSSISGNVGSDGAGVFGVSSRILGCTVSGNFAYGAGGGAYLDECQVERSFAIRSCAPSGSGFSCPDQRSRTRITAQ